MTQGKTLTPKIETTPIAVRKKQAESDKTEWMIGKAGPFPTVHGVMSASDATAAFVGKDGTYMKTVVIDGEEREAFNSCTFVRTASGRMLVQGMRAGDPGTHHDREQQHFLLFKKCAQAPSGAHGPLNELCERKEFAAGVFSARLAKPGEYRSYVFMDEVDYGPYQEIRNAGDMTGAKYLVCENRADGKTTQMDVIGKDGRIGTFGEVRTDAGVLVGIGATKTMLILGGKEFVTHDSTQVDVHVIGHSILQVVSRPLPTKERWTDNERTTLYLNKIQLAGPYQYVRDLKVDEQGHLTYTASDTDKYGVMTMSDCKTSIPKD